MGRNNRVKTKKRVGKYRKPLSKIPKRNRRAKAKREMYKARRLARESPPPERPVLQTYKEWRRPKTRRGLKRNNRSFIMREMHRLKREALENQYKLAYEASLLIYEERMAERNTRHTARAERRFTCNECGVRFNRLEHLRRHLSLHFDLATWSCDVCKRTFYEKHHLASHMKSHSHLFCRKSLFCPLCWVKFSDRHLLRAHLAEHKKISLSSESSKHKGVPERGAYPCPVCQKEFTLPRGVSKHMFTHSKTKAALCHVCGKVFSNKVNLQAHLFLHEEEKRFSCDRCGRRFTYKCSLQGHLSKLPCSKEKAETGDVMMCDCCGRKLLSLQHIREHVGTCHKRDEL